MPTCHASHVFVEEIDSGQRCTQTVSDPLRALLETWCDHELQWVLYETNAPPLWSQLGRQLRGYLATLWLTGALRGQTPGEASVKPAEFGRYRINIRLKTP